MLLPVSAHGCQLQMVAIAVTDQRPDHIAAARVCSDVFTRTQHLQLVMSNPAHQLATVSAEAIS